MMFIKKNWHPSNHLKSRRNLYHAILCVLQHQGNKLIRDLALLKKLPHPWGNEIQICDIKQLYDSQITTKYRLLHVKSLISFLFTSFYYHIANERVFERVSGMVLKMSE